MIVHRNVVLIEVADAHVFEEIRAVLPLDEFIIGWISPTRAVVDPARFRDLAARLEARGMPALVKKA